MKLLSLFAAVASALAAAPPPGYNGFVTAAPASRSSFDWNAVKYVYAFGDSYSFVQGTTGFPNFRCTYGSHARCPLSTTVLISAS